jgi:hypothetical protein
MKLLFSAACLFFACLFISYLGQAPETITPNGVNPIQFNLRAIPESPFMSAPPGESPPAIRSGNQPRIVQIGGQSYEVLEKSEEKGPDGLPNHFFYTPEQAKRLGIQRYASGPCRNYYHCEEWFCKEKESN